MVCDPQELISSNPCLSALNPFMLKVIEVQMLCGLKNFLTDGTPVTCEIDELIADASCFYGLTEFQLDVIRVQLLCEIVNLV